MAQKIVLIDDIDGSPEATKTVRFSLNDRTYEIDLSDEHVQQLDAALAPYIANAREVEAALQPALVRRRGRPRRTQAGNGSDGGRIRRDSRLGEVLVRNVSPAAK